MCQGRQALAADGGAVLQNLACKGSPLVSCKRWHLRCMREDLLFEKLLSFGLAAISLEETQTKKLFLCVGKISYEPPEFSVFDGDTRKNFIR